MNIFLAEVDIGNEFLFQGNAPAGSVPELQGIGLYVSKILPNVYVVAGLILFFLVLFGGFHVITGAGDQEKVQKGKAILTSAILGFGILFGSYWIIQIIQVLTGVPILKSTL